jgi:hypothetical protein
MRATLVLARTAALTALVWVAACGDGPTAPGIQPQITNNTDAFSYQVTGIQGFSGTYSYTWQNTGTLAKITHASDAGRRSAISARVKPRSRARRMKRRRSSAAGGNSRYPDSRRDAGGSSRRRS